MLTLNDAAFSQDDGVPLGPPLHTRQGAYCTLANRNLVAPAVQNALDDV